MKTRCEGEVKENDQSLNRVSNKFGTKKTGYWNTRRTRIEMLTLWTIAILTARYFAYKRTPRKVEILLDIVFDSRCKKERRISDICEKLSAQRDQRRKFNGPAA